MAKQTTRPARLTAAATDGGALMLAGFKPLGAKQSEAGALRNALVYLGMTAPHTGQPFSEAVLFGIGASYFTFEYKQQGITTLFIGTRVAAGPEFSSTTCERIGFKPKVRSASSVAAAEKNLKQALAQGKPIVLWVSLIGPPYFYPFNGEYHTAVAYGFDEAGDKVYLAARSTKPLVLSRAHLAAATQIDGLPKRQSLLIEASGPISGAGLKKAVKQGIQDCCTQMIEGPNLGGFKSNFGLQGLAKWADLSTNPRDRKGWPTMYADHPKLFSAMLGVYTMIERRGPGGGAFRPLYADFLDEAGKVLEKPNLSDVADQYRESAKLWKKLANTILPDSVPVFKEMKQLAQEQDALLDKKGAEAIDDLENLHAAQEQLKAKVEKSFPLSEAEVKDLLANLRDRVLAIHAAEEKAVAALQKAI